MSWKSWGERITVRVEAFGPEQSSVRIESRARNRFQVGDLGRSAENIDAFEVALRRVLDQRTRPSPE